jgi:hypothetical protein
MIKNKNACNFLFHISNVCLFAMHAFKFIFIYIYELIYARRY